MAFPALTRPAQRCLAVLTVLALTGCASVYRVDNQVESFARWPGSSAPPSSAAANAPAPPQTYRFERLPSQSTGATAQSADMLEQLAQEALKPLGWTAAADATTTPWSVEITAQGVRLPRAPWEDPWENSWNRGGFGWFSQVHIGVGRGAMLWSPGLGRADFPYYQRQVSLVIRETATGRVAYETSAAHDGRWNSTPSLWRAMISAALEGFPAPARGTRQVNLDVPR